MPCASLAMYDMLAPVSEANDRLWHFVRDRLRAAGFSAPDELDRQSGFDALWLRPDLVLAQTCGYPFIRQLRGKVRLVATPSYSFAGGWGTERTSFMLIRRDCPLSTLADFRGKTIALNDHMSNSGMNLPRAAIAPLADAASFFSDVVMTGGHVASIAVVAEGRADITGVDTVTYGLLERHAPERLKGVRVLQETPTGPGLPFITSINSSDAMVQTLRTAIADAVAHTELFLERDLGLTAVTVLDEDDYARLDAWRMQAERLGYPLIA